jgi:hypothetical protein
MVTGQICTRTFRGSKYEKLTNKKHIIIFGVLLVSAYGVISFLSNMNFIENWWAARLQLCFLWNPCPMVPQSPTASSTTITPPPTHSPGIDVREELAQHGILWNDEYFSQALRQKDLWAVKRFLRGGMKMSTGIDSQYAYYLVGNYFDSEIANLIARSHIQVDSIGRQVGNELQARMYGEFGSHLFEDPRSQLVGWKAARLEGQGFVPRDPLHQHPESIGQGKAHSA